MLNRKIFVWMMIPAAAMIGLDARHATSPSRNVAECFEGRTLDSATGICPDAEVAGPGASPGDTSNGWSPAVKEAEAASTADEALAGSH